MPLTMSRSCLGAASLALLAHWGTAAVPGAASASPSAATASALASDDACYADGEGVDCALGALQLEKRRQGIVDSEEAEAFPFLDENSIPDEMLGRWTHSKEEMIHMWQADKVFPQWGLAGDSYQKYAAFMAPFATEYPFCTSYLAYWWPQNSFWAKQVGRRLRMVHLGDVFNLARVQKFARQAAFLASMPKFDPRDGAEWGEHVAQYMRQVSESDSLDMPMLPAFFRRSSLIDQVWAPDVSMWWVENLFCDIDYWRKGMLGTKEDGKELCWDKVKFPGYGYSPVGLSEVKGTPAWPTGFNLSDPQYPEYLACQDINLNQTLFSSLCPFAGHIEPGTFGEQNWGKPPPTKEARREILLCQKKLGMEQYRTFTMTKINFASNVNLGPPIFDGLPDTSVKINNTFNTDLFWEEVQQFVSLRTTKKLKAAFDRYVEAEPGRKEKADAKVEQFLAAMKAKFPYDEEVAKRQAVRGAGAASQAK